MWKELTPDDCLFVYVRATVAVVGGILFVMKVIVATKGLLFNDSGKVLIVRKSGGYQDGQQAGLWDVPGGRIESQETLFDALRREAEEESGLVPVIGDVVAVHEKFSVMGSEQVHFIRIYYHCTLSPDADNTVRLSVDHDEYQWILPQAHTEHNLIPDVAEVFAYFVQKNV